MCFKTIQQTTQNKFQPEFVFLDNYRNSWKHKKQIKKWEADVTIPLTSDLEHSHMASPWSCAFTYRSRQKGENPVTRGYYQLSHEIADHGAVTERGEAVSDQALFPIAVRPNSFSIST